MHINTQINLDCFPHTNNAHQMGIAITESESFGLILRGPENFCDPQSLGLLSQDQQFRNIVKEYT